MIPSHDPLNDPIDHLSDAEIERYARSLVLSEINTHGQLALKNGRVRIIGCGGLGANAALSLAQAGVGHLELFDGDVVELSNLHRQPFTTDQIGQNKAEALAALIQARNGGVGLSIHPEPLGSQTPPSKASIWLDATDSDQSRHLVSQCARQQPITPPITLVFGAVLALDAQVTVFTDKARYDDLFPMADKTRQTCADQGVSGPLTILTAQIMAAETLALLMGKPSALSKHLLLIDGRDWRQRRVAR